MKKLVWLSMLLLACSIKAAMLIDPAAGGGFEAGTDFTANGWTAVNGTQINQWAVGTAAYNAGTKAVYVTNDAGVTNTYTNTSASISHFYQDVTFPAGETQIALNFNWKGMGETTLYDYFAVYLIDPAVTPAAGTMLTTGAIGANGYFNQSGWQNGTINITGTQAGNATAASTKRLVFSWKNDGSVGNPPPSTIDNISLTTALPSPEINLKGNSVSILDGDNTPSTADYTDFSSTPINANKDITFTNRFGYRQQ